MNPVFLDAAFWQPYLTLEGHGISTKDFSLQLEGLRPDYAVREETIHFEYSGRQRTTLRRYVDFPFSCGERFSLVLEYGPDACGCSKNLFLVDARSGTKAPMGWWDLARWHPYCMRPEEFDRLLGFWRRWDPRWQGEELPLLLLCQFVGLPDSGACDSLAARAAVALEGLGFPEAGRPEVPLRVPDGHYRWELDEELGWVFTSDEYCCYSIRNQAHADSREGGFPFATFAEMMADVERRLDQD